ncbi:hypothetical protein C2G38_2062423 [Gigaspora rosea]|uniref:Uncharacterized protein n=1 Tax=Gigaspora rosea TaxID=44941 RepID=A0A397VXJ2_9GLOM|nr:hypothetical protein C2G38_2062423 [Gigaspora rosea]
MNNQITNEKESLSNDRNHITKGNVQISYKENKTIHNLIIATQNVQGINNILKIRLCMKQYKKREYI